jgi:hypothetical protein
MAHLGYSLNEYGTLVSRHTCDTCGVEFQIIPGVPPTNKNFNNCLVKPCPSYDEERDVDLMMGHGMPLLEMAERTTDEPRAAKGGGR